MKHTIKSFALLGACAAFTLGPSLTGFSQDLGFYVKGDVGGNWTKDLELREFFGEPLAPGSKVKLDPGVRLGLGAGYQFVNWFALEAEGGLYANEINSISGATRLHDARFGNVPFLINAKLQWPSRCPFTPYIGAGAGFSETYFDIQHLQIGNTSIHGSDADAVFAWQGFAGVRYTLNERFSLCVEYRYFAADPASWQADNFFGPSPSDRISFGRTQSQSVSLAVNFRF